MSNTIISPYMSLPIPVVGTDPGPDWSNNLNASLTIIDQHNHAPGSGQQINPAGININANLPLNGNNLTSVGTVNFQAYGSPLTAAAPNLGCLYVAGNELYYNDESGNQVKLTSVGSVNATSSGISSGTASAAFVGGVLVVKSSSSSGANILGQSIVLTNSGNLTNQLTLSAPTLSSSYQLNLPALPSSQKIMTLDASGNMSAPYTVDNSTLTISSNVIEVAPSGITTSQIANGAVTIAKIATGALPTNNYYNGILSASGCYWNASLAGGWIVPGFFGGGTTSLAIVASNGLTVTPKAANLAGISFTPSTNTAVYMIKASFPSNLTGNGWMSYRLNDGSGIVINTVTTSMGNNGTYGNNVELFGIYAPATTSAVIISVEIFFSNSSISSCQLGFETSVVQAATGIEWQIVQITQ